MSLINKIKESIVSKAAEGLAVSIAIIIIWISSKLAPVVLPAIKSISTEILVSSLFASLALNIIIGILFFIFFKKKEFTLKYGIYWDKDKNPHCPNCKIPISGYDDYDAGKGYYCKPCGKIFRLTDVKGNDIDPLQVIKEL